MHAGVLDGSPFTNLSGLAVNGVAYVAATMTGLTDFPPVHIRMRFSFYTGDLLEHAKPVTIILRFTVEVDFIE